jgi:chromosomal replication initiation ATPase DnaA
VTVNSNDNDNPRTQIEFVANIVQEVSVNPGQFWFRDAEVGKKSTATIVVQNQGKEDLVIDSYNTKLKGLSIRLPEKPIHPGESAEIVAELKPKSAIVVLNDSVILKTNNANQPQVYVYIYGNVKDFKF